MPAKLDKVVTRSWAARVLAICLSDLPTLDRAWTKGDVRALRDSKPAWLTEARRRHAAAVEQASRARAEQLDAELTRLGFNDPDLSTLEQAVLYIDFARIHLMRATGCSSDDADQAAWRRWPESMAAEEADAGEPDADGRFW